MGTLYLPVCHCLNLCVCVCVCAVCLLAWQQSANYVYWVSLLLTLPKCSNLADAHKQMIYWGERELNKVTTEDWKDNDDERLYIWVNHFTSNRQTHDHMVYAFLCKNVVNFVSVFFSMSYELTLCLLDRYWIRTLLLFVIQLDHHL